MRPRYSVCLGVCLFAWLGSFAGCGGGGDSAINQPVPPEAYSRPAPPLTDELKATKEKLEKEGKIPRSAPPKS